MLTVAIWIAIVIALAATASALLRAAAAANEEQQAKAESLGFARLILTSIFGVVIGQGLVPAGLPWWATALISVALMAALLFGTQWLASRFGHRPVGQWLLKSLQRVVNSWHLLFTPLSLPKEDLEAARRVYNDLVVTDPNSELASKRKAEAAKTRAETQKGLVDYRAQKSLEHAKAMEAIKEPAARAKARQDAIRNQEALVKTLKGEYDLLKSLQGKGLVGENDPDLVGSPERPSAWDRYEAERNVLIDMMKSGEAPASTAPAATTPAPDAQTAAPVDVASARAIFDREVKARGLDPTSPQARQLAEDIKAGKVR